MSDKLKDEKKYIKRGEGRQRETEREKLGQVEMDRIET